MFFSSVAAVADPSVQQVQMRGEYVQKAHDVDLVLVQRGFFGLARSGGRGVFSDLLQRSQHCLAIKRDRLVVTRAR